MRRLTRALAALRCLACGSPLAIDPPAPEGGGGLPGDGRLRRGGCRREYPVVGGVPRFTTGPTGYAESFGIQWRRYDVQHPSEDREVFLAKTDFGASDLRDRLDHGLLPGSGVSVVGRRPATAAG